MRNKIVVATAIVAMLASGFLYARIRTESTTFDVLGAGYGLKTCTDPGIAATSGLPITESACAR
jgi:hypothetical protein